MTMSRAGGDFPMTRSAVVVISLRGCQSRIMVLLFHPGCSRRNATIFRRERISYVALEEILKKTLSFPFWMPPFRRQIKLEPCSDYSPLMWRTIERTPFMWEKGRGDKCCPGPESCLPRARPVLGARVSEWHIRPWDGCHRAQRQGGVYLCQAPGGMVARGSGCAHPFSPKLRQPRHRFSVGLKGCRQQHLSPEPFIKKNNNYDGIAKSFSF